MVVSVGGDGGQGRGSGHCTLYSVDEDRATDVVGSVSEDRAWTGQQTEDGRGQDGRRTDMTENRMGDGRKTERRAHKRRIRIGKV